MKDSGATFAQPLATLPDGECNECRDCSFASAESRRYRAHGSKGWIKMDPAFSYRGLKLRISRGQRIEDVRLTEVNHFAAEMDHFSECVLHGQECRTLSEEGLKDMLVIEALQRAGKDGKATKVESA